MTAVHPTPQGRWDAVHMVLLVAALEVAVPVWIDQLRHAGEERRVERARICAQAVAEHGDDVLFRSSKRGATAWAFNRLAEGLACAAFFPGRGLHRPQE